MRILHITPVLQHPELKGSARHYYFLQELAQRHQVTLLTRSKIDVPAAVLDEMRGLTVGCVVVDARSGSAGRWSRYLQDRESLAAMRRHFDRLLRERIFDVIFFHGKDVYPVVHDFEGLPFVIDFCDATSMRLRDRIRFDSPVNLPFHLAKLIQIRRIERRMLARTRQVAFISRRDRAAIVGNRDEFYVIPNGVDLKYWQRKTAYQPDSPDLVFTGVMSYPPNEDAAMRLIREVLPEVQRRFSQARLWVVGKAPSRELQRWGEQNPAVTVTGMVKDLRPYLERGGMFACPIRIASGMQNKVLEAMAMSLPVVTLPAVRDGLIFEAGLEVPVEVADDVRSFSRHLIGLMEFPERAQQLSRAARQFVLDYASWRSSARRFEAMCEEAVREWRQQ